MRVWLTRHKRWGSAVYLAGESYGTTRGAALADKLQSSGVALSGLILISCAMDLQSIVFAPANDLPYSLFLPAFANVSQYHGLLKGALGKSPAASRAAAEAFVDEEYIGALQAGARLDGKRRSRVARRIAELTGLPQALVEEKNLRISEMTYFFEALRPQGRIVGRLDARATGPMAASRTREWEFDPGIEAIASPYTMAAMAYFGEQLGMNTETRYEVSAKTRATVMPRRAPIWHARCAAIRTSRSSSAAAVTTSEHRTARATGPWRSSTRRPTSWPASSTITTTPAT